MTTLPILQNLGFTIFASIFLFIFWKLVYSCWILPTQRYRKVRQNGLIRGPTPSFPIGNLNDIKMKNDMKSSSNSFGSSSSTRHDIHSTIFPYFARWQKLHGKVFLYWLGVEPFLYIGDAEFLRKFTSGVTAKSWGKPSVFKRDREPMFGNGLIMVEGNEWQLHRHIINPAFNSTNLKAMTNLMVESTTTMMNNWNKMIKSGSNEIDVENEITSTAGEIIAKTSFGLSYDKGRIVYEKLRQLQVSLFKSNPYQGIPYSKLLSLRNYNESKKLGRELDQLLLETIMARKETMVAGQTQKDLLGVLLEKNHGDSSKVGQSLTTRELVDECKTFFFGGHETTALAITWALMLLALNPSWQEQLREEIKEVVGDNELDFSKLADLKKMGYVFSETLRLYPSAPNAQRQTRHDIKVDDDITVPNGTNVWIDIVSLHHDKDIWGDDADEFKPERFQSDPVYGGCKDKMGYVPFGFGGRMCVGRNLSAMEFKVVLTLILAKFSFAPSPTYVHLPTTLLSLRPSHGLPLVVQLLECK